MTSGVRFQFRRQQRLETMRFFGDHDGEALAAVRLGEPDLDFHAELLGEPVQSGAQGGGAASPRPPGRLEGHAELAARDLFFQRLDIGFLLEKKIGDAGDDAGFIAPDDSDGGELFHGQG